MYTPQQAHKRFGIAPSWTEKDYDLLSNKYHYGHDEYVEVKRAGALDTAAEKFFARNDKNPVTGKFYDQGKEETIALQEEDAKLTHGVHQMDIYPPRIKYGPGMAFDLARHTVKDGELMALLREKDEEKRRGAFRAMEKRELEEKYISQRDADEFKKAGRQYMKISTKRYAAGVDRGYDVVTNESLRGMGGKVVFPHRLPERQHFWNTLGPSKQQHVARMGRRGGSAPGSVEMVELYGGNPPPVAGGTSSDTVSGRIGGSSRRSSIASSRRERVVASSGGGGVGASGGGFRDVANGGEQGADRAQKASACTVLQRPADVPALPLAGAVTSGNAMQPQGVDRPLGLTSVDSRLQGSWRSSRSRASSVSTVRSSGMGGLNGF